MIHHQNYLIQAQRFPVIKLLQESNQPVLIRYYKSHFSYCDFIVNFDICSYEFSLCPNN